jgi:hypothetical protein
MKKEYYVILMAMLYLTSCSTKVLTLSDVKGYKVGQDLDEIQFFISGPLVLEPVGNTLSFDINGIEENLNYRLKYPKGWAGVYGTFAEKGLYSVRDKANAVWSLKKNPYLKKDSVFVLEKALQRLDSDSLNYLVADEMRREVVSGEWNLVSDYHVYEARGELVLIKNSTESARPKSLDRITLLKGGFVQYAPQYNVYQKKTDLTFFLIKDRNTIHKPDSLTFKYPTLYKEHPNAIFIEYGDGYGLWFTPNSTGKYELLTLNDAPLYPEGLVQIEGKLYKNKAEEQGKVEEGKEAEAQAKEKKEKEAEQQAKKKEKSRIYLKYKQKSNIFKTKKIRIPRQERIGNNRR